MPRPFVRTALVALLPLAALLPSACGSDGEPTPPQTETATITGAVRENGGAGVSGVAVALTGVASRSTSTSSNGTYRFEGLAPGNYTVAITPPTGYSLPSGQQASRAVTAAAGASATVDFNLDRQPGNNVVVVELRNNAFVPSEVTISPGQTVRWVNREAVFHTVTPDGHGTWGSTSLNQDGQIFEHTFTAAGSFPYYCQPHRGAGMTGRIVVQ